MCTAICLNGQRHLFGRTLDVEREYGEEAVITPRLFPFSFTYGERSESHGAIIGTATVRDGVPLYFDAMNEFGLASAGLNFPSEAVYLPPRKNMHNVASFEFIPFVLSKCKSVSEAKMLLKDTIVTGDSFCDGLCPTPLHWIIADKGGCLVAEPCESGLKLYDNPTGVMTNAPSLPHQLAFLSRHMQLGAAAPQNRICPSVNLNIHSRGMGGIGLPGDFSSESRFVRAAFIKSHTVLGDADEEISRFFHVMDCLSIPCGCVIAENGRPHLTRYVSCADLDFGDYYFTTYENRRIRKLSLRSENLDTDMPMRFSMTSCEDIRSLN